MAENKVEYIPVNKIRQNEVALRGVDRESEGYLGLQDSVKKKGILIPILVREYENPDEKGTTLYGLIDGLQRYNAALDAGLEKIPAQITDKDQAEIEEIQIITNAKKIETKPIQYAQQIDRLLNRNPTLTVNELAGRLSSTPNWIYKMLGMLKKLHSELKPLVDNSTIKLSQAIELSKLPPEEQMTWSDAAITKDIGEFTAMVAQRVKSIKEDRRKGKLEAPPTFEPVAHGRKWGEVRSEYLTPTVRDGLLERAQATTAQQGWNLAIAWCSWMDPDSQAQQRADHVAAKQKQEEDKVKKQLERTQQKEAEAKKIREELEAKVKAASTAVAAA